MGEDLPGRIVSVVIPAHDAENLVGVVVTAVLEQARPSTVTGVEVLVVNDGSTDRTVERAVAAGARVVHLDPIKATGNPAAARNLGAMESSGDPIIFLDADCVPAPGWLEAILESHLSGATVVGGALDLPGGLSPTARCDYYCSFYHSHSRMPGGRVVHHPAPNVSVRRAAFESTSGFWEEEPFCYSAEERSWQGELRRSGHQILFQPRAVACHHNRPGFVHLLRRNYRWAFAAIPAKALTGTARMAWIYRYPRTLILVSAPLALVHTAYICWRWIRAGTWEPLVMLPGVFASRLAYGAGLVAGGLWWIREGQGRHGLRRETEEA